MSDEIGRGDGLESAVDTGNVNAGEMAGGEAWGQGQSGSGAHAAGNPGGLADDAIVMDRDEAVDRVVEAGGERQRFESIDDVYAHQREEQARMDAEDEAWEEYVAEQERLEAEKNAAREEAHANEEAFLENEYTQDGETYQEWSLPDGTVITINEDGEAVSVEWPEGEGPVYIGDVLIGGEPHAVYLLPTGTQIVVDDQGNTIGTLDEVDVDDMSVPLYWVTGDKEDVGEMVTIELVPNPDGSYDTQIVDAETDEVIGELDTGGAGPGVALGQDDTETYQTYVPPGSDHYVVIDENGTVVGTHPVPEEPEWSVLGIVEYYEDGGVVVDLGVVEVEVDVVGPDGGISVDLDLLVAEGTAGIEWNEDGSWEFDSSIELDAGGASIEAGLGFGQDADGMWHVDIETAMEMQIGLLSLEGGQHAHFQQTPDGFEANIGWEGRIETFGFYVERTQSLSFTLDEDGTTTTYSDMIGAGHEMLGGVELTGEMQMRTSEDGVDMGGGVHGAIVDDDGDVQIQGGAYADTEHGLFTQEGKLDDGRDYERQYRDANLPNALGDDAESRGQEDVERFGLAGQEGEEAAGRLERLGADDGPVGQHAGRARSGPEDEAPREVPAAVTEALRGRYADVGTNADHLLGQTEGSTWRLARQSDDAVMRPAFGDGVVEPTGFYEKGNKAAGLRDGEQPEYLGETEKNVTEGADGVYLDDIIVGATDAPGTVEQSQNPDGSVSGLVMGKGPVPADQGFYEKGNKAAGLREGDAPDGVYVEEVSLLSDQPAGDDLWAQTWVNGATDGPPEGAQVVSDPPPSEEDDADDAPAERPTIWQRRDGDPTDPKDEDPVDPSPTPRPRDEWPKIATERFRDADEDGDGVPDRWGPDGLILGDNPTLDDITGAPPARQTADAGVDQSAGGIERPGGDDHRVEIDVTASVLDGETGVRADPLTHVSDDITAAPVDRQTTEATPDQSQGGIERPDAGEPFTRDAGPQELSGDADWEAGVWTDMRPLASSDSDRAEAADEPYVVEEAIPMRDADRGQLPDGYGDGKRDGADRDGALADDIAPVAPAARPDPVVDPEPESVAQVETAIPAFRPEVEDEVIVGVADQSADGYQALPELDADAEIVVDLADTGGDELFNMDAGTTELADHADDQQQDG